MANNEYLELKEQLDRVEKLTLLASKTVFTIDEVCIYIGISKSHMYKLTSGQLIPYYKPNGKNIYFKRDEIDEWLLQNRVSTLEEIESSSSTYLARKSI